MPTSRPFLTLLTALPLACTSSPGTSTGATTEPSTGAASTSTAGESTHATHADVTHADASTHAEPTGTTHAHATDSTSTGHAHTGETTHATHTTAGTAGTTGEPSAIDVYCACMLTNCHDEYHAAWGEDHEASEAMCAAAAAAVPSVGVPATTGNSLECRQHYCDLGEAVPGACASAMGGGACVD